MMSARKDQTPRVIVENVHVPGATTRLDAGKFNAVRAALLGVLPFDPPGLTQAGMIEAVQPHLPQDLFPGGAKSGWWVKSVQLDLEAKGVVVRDPGRPTRWRQVRQAE